MLPTRKDFLRRVVKREKAQHMEDEPPESRAASADASGWQKKVEDRLALEGAEGGGDSTGAITSNPGLLLESKSAVRLPLKPLPSVHRSLVGPVSHLELLEKLKKDEDRKARDLRLKAKIRQAQEEKEKKRLEIIAIENSPEVKKRRQEEAENKKLELQKQLKLKEELKLNKEKKFEESMKNLTQTQDEKTSDKIRIRQNSQL